MPSEIGRFLALFSISWMLLSAPPAAAAESSAPRFSVSWIEIVGDDSRHRFTVELARSPAQRAQGLQHRRHLPDDRGMLFDFGESRPIYMWMKNTPIPLDMLFVRRDGRIAGIARETEPHSLATIASPGPVRYVLEVAGGTAARLGIAAGDRLAGPALDAP